jgi:hypothetical protein
MPPKAWQFSHYGLGKSNRLGIAWMRAAALRDLTRRSRVGNNIASHSDVHRQIRTKVRLSAIGAQMMPPRHSPDFLGLRRNFEQRIYYGIQRGGPRTGHVLPMLTRAVERWIGANPERCR